MNCDTVRNFEFINYVRSKDTNRENLMSRHCPPLSLQNSTQVVSNDKIQCHALILITICRFDIERMFYFLNCVFI